MSLDMIQHTVAYLDMEISAHKFVPHARPEVRVALVMYVIDQLHVC